MPLQIRIALPSRKGQPGRPASAACDLTLQASVIPSVLAWVREVVGAYPEARDRHLPGPAATPRDTVSLTGHGKIDARQPAVFSKEFDLAASLRPRETAVVASGSADTGGQRVRFEVTATATVEEGRVKRPPDGPTRPPGHPANGDPSARPRSSSGIPRRANASNRAEMQ